MARLPDPYNVRRAPQGAGPSVPSFGDLDAETGFGASLARAGREMRIADTALATAKADQLLLQGGIAAEGAIEQAGDWRGWDGTYSAHMEKVLNEASALIPDRREREAFVARGQTMLMRGQESIRGRQRAREADEGRAWLGDLIETNVEGALATADPSQRAALIGNITDAIGAAEGKGWVDAERAGELRRGTVENYELRRIEMLPPEAQFAAVAGGLAGMDAAGLLRHFESFREVAYPDMTIRNGERVNSGYRAGYGSDTVTLADGRIVRVSVGTRVTREDAERDLDRRTREFASNSRSVIGAEEWDSLPANARAALTSVAYNYGSLGRKELKGVVDAARYGDTEAIAQAIEGLAGHNSGINRKRRLTEAAIVRSGTGGAQYLPPDVRVKIANSALVKMEQERSTATTAYLGGLGDYLAAVQAGADVSGEIASRYSDDEIARNVDDAEQRRLAQATRDDALAQADIMQRIRGASPAEIGALAAEVQGMTGGAVTDDVGLALAPDRAKAQAALRVALEADMKARQDDPARYAAGVSEAVQNAAAGIGRGGEEAYAEAMMAEQQRLGIRPQLLPNAMAKTLAGQVAEIEPDKRGAVVATLAEQWGTAWPRVLNELKASGLDAATYHAALVSDDPVLSERVASLATMPVSELAQGLPDTDVRDIKATVETGMADFRSVFEAGDPTGAAARTMNELQDIATGLALQEYRRTGNVTGAAERAMWDLLDSRYHILDSQGFAAYVPRELNIWKVEAAASAKLTDEELAKVVPFGGDEDSPDFIRNSRIRGAAKNGTWVTNADGTGLTLMVDVDGRWMPIMTDDGPFGITFEETQNAWVPYADPMETRDFYGRPIIQ